MYIEVNTFNTIILNGRLTHYSISCSGKVINNLTGKIIGHHGKIKNKSHWRVNVQRLSLGCEIQQ